MEIERKQKVADSKCIVDNAQNQIDQFGSTNDGLSDVGSVREPFANKEETV